MEQTANLQEASFSGAEMPDRTSDWRSFGSVASALLAKAEAQQGRTAGVREDAYVPFAWAAE